MQRITTYLVAGAIVTGMAGTGTASAGERRFGAGEGSGRATITAVEGTVGSLLELSVLETHTSSQVSPRADTASADWHVATAQVGGAAGLHLPEEPFTSQVKEDPSGRDATHRFGTDATTLKLPKSGQSVEADWDQLRKGVNFLAEELTGMDMDPDGGPRGSDDVSMLDGALLKVTANPAGLVTEQGSRRSYAHAQSEVELVRMLEGLNTIVDAGPGDHGSLTEEEQAGSWSREVKVEEMRLLELSALLRLLQVNVDLLPPAVMAAMVDALGVEPGDLAQHTGEFTKAELESFMAEFGDLEATVQAAEHLLAAVLDGAGLVGCDEIDDFVKQAEEVNLVKRSRAFGIEPLDCLGGVNALERYLRRVEKLVADLDALVDTTAEEVSLVGVDDIDMGMTATAAVTGKGVPLGGVLIDATAAVVRFGKETVGSFSLADNMESWNQLESSVNDRINALLAPLGTAFEDVVRIRMAPTVVEEVGMAGRWVTARGEFELMKVYVAPPAVDPVKLIEDAGGSVDATVGDLVDGVVEDLTGGGGGLGPVGGILGATSVHGQLGAVEPVELTFGVMSAQARHTREGWDVDTCRDLGTCADTTTTDLANTPWDPAQGGPGGNGGQPGPGEPLPRTGGYPGALAMLVTASGAVLVWRRK